MFDENRSRESSTVFLGSLVGLATLRMRRYSLNTQKSISSISSSLTNDSVPIHSLSQSSQGGQSNQSLMNLESPYDILNKISSDPLLLSVVTMLCIKKKKFVTSIQLALVGLSYLDLDRPASMALPRFHSFCWCAVGGSMALFGLLGQQQAAKEAALKASKESNAASNDSSRGSFAGLTLEEQFKNIAVYRQKLKLSVHRLASYGKNVQILKGYCFYMRGWWRLSRGYIKKALHDWKAVLETSTNSPITLTVRTKFLLNKITQSKRYTPNERCQLLYDLLNLIPIPDVQFYNDDDEYIDDNFQDRESSNEDER